MNNTNTSKSYNLAVTAILLAVVVLLQCVLGAVKIGTVSLTFVLIPIVLGAVAVNWKVGAILGFGFGVITYVMGLIGADGFTFILINDHPILTALVCLVKGTASGLVAGLVFNLFKGKGNKEYIGLFISSFIAPTVNTGLFIIGALFMSDTLTANFTNDVLYFLIVVCAGVNYLIEVALNMAFVPALYRVYTAVTKRSK